MTESALLGLGLGLLYGLASYVTYLLAMRVSDAYSTAVVLGGVLFRMTFFLAAIALTVTFTGVDEFEFVGAFFVTFVLVLILEVYLLHRSAPTSIKSSIDVE